MHRNSILSNSLVDFEALAGKTDKIIFTFDIETRTLLYISPAFEKIWNISITEISVQPSSLLNTVHPEDKYFVLRRYSQVFNDAETGEIEFRILCPDKTIRWIVLNSYLIQDEPVSRRLVGFAEDISKLKENEMVLQKFAAKKDSVLEILSHDLAGPLNNVKGITALLTRKLKNHEQPELDNLVKMIEDTNERSIRLIREFVKMEFLESQGSELVKTRVDIVAELREVVEQYKNSENELSKELYFQTSSEQIFVAVDVYKFSRVINNLMSNALKFTETGGIINLSIEKMDEKVLIKVSDNGIGIPAKYHEHLFDKFNKARRPGLRGEPSVGLGMSIIKTIVDWHGGKIWFESEEGRGSIFYIELLNE